MISPLEKIINKYFNLFLFAGIAANIPALFTEIMDQDSALYACVAKHIATSGDWVNLIGYGSDWLDKPHLPFWLTAISFKIFGLKAFAYKLPSFLCWLAGVYFTYKLALAFYNKSTAQLTVIIFITSLHIILANYDVRAEGYLTTFIAAAIYYLHKLYKENTWKHVLTAACCCAMAVMTKGIFVLMTIAGGFIIHWLLTKQWKQFANIKWYALIAFTLLFIMPELYCLYVQFDLHPEKTVWGQQHFSGIRFFFWDSQFGRFFNTGPIKGKGDPSFFFHTTLWAFLPWSIILVAALFSLFKSLKKNIRNERVIITGSALISFFVFSISQFQLPHYIVILFPHFSMICADWLLLRRQEKTLKTLSITAWVIYAVLTAAIILLLMYYRFNDTFILTASAAILTAACIWIYFKNRQASFISTGLCFALLSSVFIQTFFYRELMHYNAGMQAARWMNDNKPAGTCVMLDCNNFPFEFYADSYVQRRQGITQKDFTKPDSTIIVFGSLASLQKTDTVQIQTEILKRFNYFRITKLNAKFINHTTRPAQTERYVLAACRLK